MSSNISKKTMRSAVPAATVEIRIVYILVMGLTGAGKSTFVSVVTGNEDIPIGKDGELDGGAYRSSIFDRDMILADLAQSLRMFKIMCWIIGKAASFTRSI